MKKPPARSADELVADLFEILSRLDYAHVVVDDLAQSLQHKRYAFAIGNGFFSLYM